MLDLGKGARPQDQFHLQQGAPVAHPFGWKYFVRRVSWSNVWNADDSKGWFVSWQVLYFLRWYRGSAKCDGTRTRMYWNGDLGQPSNVSKYVMNTWSEELWSIRFRYVQVSPTRWDSMGSI